MSRRGDVHSMASRLPPVMYTASMATPRATPVVNGLEPNTLISSPPLSRLESDSIPDAARTQDT
eukprot:4514052-Prymnesium_polylepis.1